MEEKSPIEKIVDILADYYGEDKVDIYPHDADKSRILIYFPRVTVTNENNRSTEITELYVMLSIDNNGLLIGSFLLNRSEYSTNEWASDYMHSHVCGINKANLSEFSHPCLGSGPIRGTCCSLNTAFDEDLWRLFSLELDRYVHTESIVGVPYRYLERINKPSYTIMYYNKHTWIKPENMDSGVFRRFIPYLIRKRPFSFGFNRRYYIADSYNNMIVKMSNTFIEWYNSLPDSEKGTIKTDMLSSGALIVCKIENGNIFIDSSRTSDLIYRHAIGMELFRFKGKPVKLNIVMSPERPDENTSVLINPNIVMYIINRIVEVINYKYGRTVITDPYQEEFFI